jgi:hypothetical protein
MKKIALAVASLVTAAAPLAMAQDNSNRNYPYDPYWAERQLERDRFYAERDLRLRDDYYRRDWRGDWRGDGDWRDRGVRRECWNPRAGHFEEDRPGEFQNDLDYSRCRLMRWR